MSERDCGLGIDTGGTFTDAAVVDMATNTVLAAAKAPTTRYDLSVGIANAIRRLPPEVLARVGLVSLSTTLATNAIVEGNGAPTCLVLIGYDRELIRSYKLDRLLPTANVAYIAGGHNTVGNELQPLDEEALRALAREQAGSVQAFAVSGFFGVRNPDHELRAGQILAEATGLPVTRGHELASELDSVLRAATCALNASLIPLLHDLMRSVNRALEDVGIVAPVMVVRGDGSLMRVEMAMDRPVETILSGPAASVVGARALTRQDDMLVVDIGGTTTDLAVVKGGLPLLNSAGASVGRWRTLVRAVQTVSSGLGGDSQVSMNGSRRLQVGPRRVVPLAFVGHQAERVRHDLRRAVSIAETLEPGDADFFLMSRSPDGHKYGDVEQRILRALESGPQPLWRLSQRDPWVYMYLARPNFLERSGVIIRSGFTPTDALHVAGEFSPWDAEAALLGARMLARYLGVAPEELARMVLRAVSTSLARSVVSVLLGERAGQSGNVDALLMELAFAGNGAEENLEVSLRSRLPVVGLGAPAGHFVTPAERLLNASVHIPDHYEVANAVGAICGSVVVREVVEVHAIYKPSGLAGYALTGPFVAEHYGEREEAVAEARARAHDRAREQALAAGATDIEVRVVVDDQEGTASPGFGDKLYLGTTVVATAVGRPRFAYEVPREAEETDLW